MKRRERPKDKQKRSLENTSGELAEREKSQTEADMDIEQTFLLKTSKTSMKGLRHK